MSLNLRALNTDETGMRDASLELASRLAGVPRPLTMGDVQSLYEACLDVDEPPAEAMVAIGLSFGEQIVVAADFEWVRVSDEYGDETCVAAPGKEIYCAPISMIQKRIEQRERLSLAELRDETIATIVRRIQENKAADRA